MNTQNYQEWVKIAKKLGATIEHDGTGKLAAHIDGDDIGYWDPNYASVGIGVIHL
jgi:hypothetical protein